jgi:hypothetical protein
LLSVSALAYIVPEKSVIPSVSVWRVERLVVSHDVATLIVIKQRTAVACVCVPERKRVPAMWLYGEATRPQASRANECARW